MPRALPYVLFPDSFHDNLIEADSGDLQERDRFAGLGCQEAA